MKNLKIYLPGIFILLLLGACSTSKSTITQTPNQIAEQNTQYPAPQGAITKVPGYPAPEITITENPYYPPPITPESINPYPVVTRDPHSGLIRGRLLRNNTPVPNIILDLADVIKDNTGKDIIAGLDRVNSPNTETDIQGYFTFINIKEGRYALILDIITNQFLLNFPGSENPIIIQVEASKEIDLGELNYDDLPVP